MKSRKKYRLSKEGKAAIVAAAKARAHGPHVRHLRESSGRPYPGPAYPQAAQIDLEADAKAYAADKAAEEGMTYGQRAVSNKAKLFKIPRANLIEMLNDAYREGENDKSKWAEGVQRQLREQIADLKREVTDYSQRMERAEILCDILIERGKLYRGRP